MYRKIERLPEFDTVKMHEQVSVNARGDESVDNFLYAVIIAALEEYSVYLEMEQQGYLLYAFIDNCISDIGKLRSFGKGHLHFDAVDQAVSSELSSGFVEGMNNKVKCQRYG